MRFHSLNMDRTQALSLIKDFLIKYPSPNKEGAKPAPYAISPYFKEIIKRDDFKKCLSAGQKIPSESTIRRIFKLAESEQESPLKGPNIKGDKILAVANICNKLLELFEEKEEYWDRFQQEEQGAFVPYQEPIKSTKSFLGRWLISSIPFKNGARTLVGRESDLATLQQLLNEYHAVVITGIGGMGKSMLVSHYAEYFSNSYDYVLPISVAKGIQTSFMEKGRLLWKSLIRWEVLPQDTLQLLSDNEQINEDDYDLLIGSLKAMKGRNLLILDNLEQLEELSSFPLIGKRVRHWQVLITSQYTSTHQPAYHYPISPLEPADALQLFQQVCPYLAPKITLEHIQSLFQNTEYHPKAIELIAWRCEKDKITIEELLDSKKQSPTTQGADIEFDIDSLIASHFKKQLPKNPNQLLLLKQFTILAPIPIPLADLQALLGHFIDNLANALFELKQNTWLEEHTDDQVCYRIHPVVQRVVKKLLHSEGTTFSDYQKLAQSLLKVLTDNNVPNRKKISLWEHAYLLYSYWVTQSPPQESIAQLGHRVWEIARVVPSISFNKVNIPLLDHYIEYCKKLKQEILLIKAYRLKALFLRTIGGKNNAKRGLEIIAQHETPYIEKLQASTSPKSQEEWQLLIEHYNITGLLLNKSGVKENITKAVKQYENCIAIFDANKQEFEELAYKRGRSQANYNLSFAYQGLASYHHKDKAEAKQFLQKALKNIQEALQNSWGIYEKDNYSWMYACQDLSVQLAMESWALTNDHPTKLGTKGMPENWHAQYASLQQRTKPHQLEYKKGLYMLAVKHHLLLVQQQKNTDIPFALLQELKGFINTMENELQRPFSIGQSYYLGKMFLSQKRWILASRFLERARAIIYPPKAKESIALLKAAKKKSLSIFFG